MFGDTWDALNAEADEVDSIEVRRRIYPESKADLWLVVSGPSRTRLLRVAVGGQTTDVELLPTGSGIEVRVDHDSAAGPALEVSLTNPAFADLFDALVQDLATTAANASIPGDVPSVVLVRIQRWQAFLREHSLGLSRERQRGLYGELLVCGIVAEVTGPVPAVEGWVGPSGAPQDFAFGGTAVEVKTNAGKNPQRVRISSERQLDDAPVDRLFLWHVSVDERDGVGVSLPSAVGKMRLRAAGSSAAVGLEEALFAAGYHDAHAGRYTIGYSLRISEVFQVGEGFPRITEADCPSGLGDVHYSVELGALSAFRIDEGLLLGSLASRPSND